ncbi:MAG: RsmE family RNA methyltransferase [Bryobacteraceae bacterium]
MARRLFFVPEVSRGTAELKGADAEHLVRVLRAEPGEVYEISDNRRAYLAKIESARKSSVVFQVMEELPDYPEAATVHLFPALFKFDRFEWMLEKATELGATKIQAFNAARSDGGLARAAPKRVERWKRIALEASQQSRRRKLPEIELAESLESVAEQWFEVKLLLDESRSAPSLFSILGSIEKSVHDRIGILLGPEGGWTDIERQTILSAGWKAGSLGSSILRAETAAIAALSVINVLWTR